MNADPWRDIRRAFPDACDRRSDILDFVREHPGCRSSRIRQSLGLDGAGLFRVLFQLHREGGLVSERGCIRVPGPLRSSGDTISTESTVTHGPKGSA